MITILLENTSLHDLVVDVTDQLQGSKVVFQGVLTSGEVETIIVEANDRDYCSVTWCASRHPGQVPKIRTAEVGPGDTVEISA